MPAMNFSDAIQSGFKNYAKAEGRASRSEFWFWILFSVLLSIAASTVDSALINPPVRNPFGLFVNLFLCVPTICMNIRRLHDADRTGWWVLIGLIPLLGVIVLIIFGCLEGTKGANQFGPEPPSTTPRPSV